MSAERVRSRTPLALLTAVALLLAACGGGTGHGGSAFVFLTITQITTNRGAAAASSDLNDPNASTVVCVTFSNTQKSPTVTSPTALDSVTITAYTVSFTRFDGGPPPGPFTNNTTFTVPAGTVSNGVSSPGAGSFLVVVVPAQAKREPPLEPRPRLPLSTTADMLFRGKDGRGNSVSVEGSVNVDFTAGGGTENPPSSCSGAVTPTPSP